MGYEILEHVLFLIPWFLAVGVVILPVVIVLSILEAIFGD